VVSMRLLGRLNLFSSCLQRGVRVAKTEETKSNPAANVLPRERPEKKRFFLRLAFCMMHCCYRVGSLVLWTGKLYVSISSLGMFTSGSKLCAGLDQQTY